MSIEFRTILELTNHNDDDIEVKPLLLKCNKCRVLNLLKTYTYTSIGTLYTGYSFDECCQCKSYDNLVIECQEYIYSKGYFLKFIPYRKLVKIQIVTYNVGELLWKLN